jgi:class 3 adenylate cyclase
MDTAGDGVFAIFDETDDAIRCALDIREQVRPLGFELRAGVHLGHCWNADAKCAGADVHIGARLVSAAEPGEVLISEVAAERACESGLVLTDRGTRSLQGLPGTWRVFAIGTEQPDAVLGARRATPDAPFLGARSKTSLTDRRSSIYLGTSI